MLLQMEGYDPQRLALEETLFHTANGYLGVRASLEEGAPQGAASVRGAYINGFYDIKPIEYGERLYGFPLTQQGIVNLTDVQTILLEAEGERLQLDQGQVLGYSRTLDMQKGVATRRMHWRSPQGREIELSTRRMVCFEEEGLFILDYQVTALNFSGRARILSLMEGDVANFADPNDPRVAAQALRHLQVQNVTAAADTGIIESVTGVSKLTLACAVRHTGAQAGTPQITVKDAQIQFAFNIPLLEGQPVALTKWCAYADSRRHSAPAQAALALLARASEQSWAYWAQRQRTYLAAFWARSRVEVQGNDALQRSLDFSLYSLLQSAGRDGISAVAAKGLSGEGYEGHYFWDTEIYIFPFFLLTDPALARRLLDYRHAMLPGALAHARQMGHQQGALYPWRTIAGSECSGYFPSGSAQYHINGDIAHAFIQYYLATDDVDYMASHGVEVLVQTARLWLDAGHYADGQFRLDDVTGPDEYTCIVNNNFYTNAVARENLLWAARLVRLLQQYGLGQALLARLQVTQEELEAFARAGEAMYLPYDERLGIHAQDDTFLQKKALDLKTIPAENFPLLLHYHPLFLYRHQVLKQADTVLAHFLFEDLADLDIMRRSYEYYEPLTTHDSSLSTCVYAIMAAKLGDTPKAMRYFNMTATMDLDDAHGNTKDGIHTANMGGAYLVIVCGFAGLRIKPDGLYLHPRLPDGLDGYAFPFVYRGRGLRCQVDAQGCTLILLSGAQLKLTLWGQQIILNGEQHFPLP